MYRSWMRGVAPACPSPVSHPGRSSQPSAQKELRRGQHRQGYGYGRPSLLPTVGIPYSTPFISPKCPCIAHATCPMRMLIKPDKPASTRVWMSETPFGFLSLKVFCFQLLPTASWLFSNLSLSCYREPKKVYRWEEVEAIPRDGGVVWIGSSKFLTWPKELG